MIIRLKTNSRALRLTALLAVVLTMAVAKAQPKYTMLHSLSLDTAGHYIHVRLDLKTAPTGAAQEMVLNMPVWAPGYYEILNFPKHLCDFAVSDAEGRRQPWRKEGKNRWRITVPADGHACVTYRVFANLRDVASSRVERDVAFIAPCGVFMHVDGDLGHASEVSVTLPQGWTQVATGLKQGEWNTNEKTRVNEKEPLTATFQVKDFDTLYDSPLLLGNFTLQKFTHDGRWYEFALETPEGADEMDLKGNFCRIVSAATELMGDVPYTFYSLIHMGAGGGGLEHLNSQACYTDGTYHFSSRRAEVKFLAFVAHEYFHLYNVKCIRPAELWPLNYNEEAITPMLWVSEGLTCYYEFRLLRYAGIATPDESLELLTTYFSLYAPYEGQRHQSLRASSYDIWLNFMNQDANSRDVRVNYYFKGPVVGLLLDIDIRRKTRQQHSLDDVMRLLYQRFYRELQRGFTEEEFWAACAEVAGQPLDDVRHIVETTDDIDYDFWLKDAGLYVTDDYRICRVEKPTRQQRDFLKAMRLWE
ncbi:MAG: M61 family metallopeptidase [Bacteroidaceae bacterium]|nr:M61 family metallopeptidase [Bacteroidaceae bacterium]